MTNYYVVYKGKKTGIFYTWDECKENVLGFKGAIYKKFFDFDIKVSRIYNIYYKEKDIFKRILRRA